MEKQERRLEMADCYSMQLFRPFEAAQVINKWGKLHHMRILDY
jgi:hypothetical protein